MRRFLLALAAAAAALIPTLAQPKGNPFLGRWDLTLTRESEQFPSWLEVTERDGALQARAQQRTGNVNPVVSTKLDGGRLTVIVAGSAEKRNELVWEMESKGGKLAGTQKRGDVVWQLTGMKAPALKRAAPKAWTQPEPLFNGKDLTGWEPINNTPGISTNYWTVKDGELVNEGKGSNLRTKRVFDDFKVHVEYFCPQGENSGIYLRGRYEAQVAAPPAAPRPAGGGRRPGGNPYPGVGCIYGFLGPSEPPPFRPDWQTYDITLVGRMVTVVFNGVTTIDNQEIPGITGGAIDSNEGAPGPIYFQGDHHGGIRYRNITISVPRK
jgi:hypothetical protein